MKTLNLGVEGLLALLFGIMVLTGGLQVACRFFLNLPLTWSEEVQRYSHIWLVALGIPVAYNKGSHIGTRLVLDRLPAALQTAAGFLTHTLWLTLGLAMTVWTGQVIEVARAQTSPALGIPMSVAYLGLFLGGLYLVLLAAAHLVQFRRKIA